MALAGTPIVTQHPPFQLKRYVYGDQVGTTSLAFINTVIAPKKQPKVFNTLNDVKQALQTHQIAALVTDMPTAQFIHPPRSRARSWSASSPAPASITGCCSARATRSSPA